MMSSVEVFPVCFYQRFYCCSKMNFYWQTYITGTIGIPVLQKCSKQIV